MVVEESVRNRTFHVPSHPGSSSPTLSERMSRARRRDTTPELRLRRALHGAGMRYRVAYPVPGHRRRTIDIAFTKARLAVFVDGCFWHGCPEHGTMPSSNSAWWATKIAANQARDADTDMILEDLGWVSIRVWEHTEPDEALPMITEALGVIAHLPEG